MNKELKIEFEKVEEKEKALLKKKRNIEFNLKDSSDQIKALQNS